MTKKIYEETDIQAIANAIRSKNDLTSLYKVSQMAGAINALRMAKDVLPQDDVSGAVANFPDGSDNYPVVDLTAEINPIQEGTGDPSPSNIRPISGFSSCTISRTGVNLWDEQWEVGSYNTNDGTKLNVQDRIRSKNFISVIPNSQYFIKLWTGSTFSIRLFCYDKSYNFISSPEWLQQGVITIPNNVYFITFTCASAYGTTYNNDISINYPATDTDYHAYNGETKTTNFGQTVYGGSLDLTTGILTIDRKSVDLDSLTWTYHLASGSYSDYFDTNLPNDSITGDGSIAFNGICQIYKSIPSAQIATSGYDNNVMALAANTHRFIVCDQRFNNESDLVQEFQDEGIILLYPLATPETIQLTPAQVNTILGVNNIWADCNGDVDVTYRADVDLYIQKIINEA